MKMPVNIRTAVPADRERIYRLFLEMLRSIYGEKAWEPGGGFLDQYFSGGNNVIFLAEADGRTVGFLSVEEHHEEENYLYLDDFCVEEAFRGQGIGHALLQKAEDLAAGRQIRYIVLHVEKSNVRAAKLYTSLGYKDFGAKGSRIRMLKMLF